MNELARFLVKLLVRLREDEQFSFQGKPVRAYYKVVGVTVTSSDQLRQLVTGSVEDGAVDWSESDVNPVDYDELREGIQESSGDPNVVGIWYCSGKAYFPDAAS